jgi:hypothetical protein
VDKFPTTQMLPTIFIVCAPDIPAVLISKLLKFTPVGLVVVAEVELLPFKFTVYAGAV